MSDGNFPARITRTESTEDAYLKRALWFEGYVARALNIADASPEKTVCCAIAQKSGWTASTWRQIKASLIFRFESMKTPEALRAVMVLRAETQSGTLKKSTKTSSQRRKNVSDTELERVLQALLGSASKYKDVLSKWLTLGALFGLRPHEYSSSELRWMSTAEVEGCGNTLDRRPYLIVKNSKNSNGRTHGIQRHLNLSLIDQDTLNELGEFILLMTLVVHSGEYEKYYEGCKALLNRTNKNMRSPSGKRLQIYSARHKFAALAKKTLSPQEVGALMGHGTDKTASLHYGNKHLSTGILGVTPIAQEVAKVQQKRRSMPAHLAARNEKPQKVPSSRPKRIKVQVIY